MALPQNWWAGNAAYDEQAAPGGSALIFPKPFVASEPARASLVRQALRLEWVTAGWMLIEAAVAIGSGAAAHSPSLVAFGADSLIELSSAGVLLWRLNVEMRRGAEFPERVERRASRIGAVLLFGLATYVVISAAYGFCVRRGQEFSTAQIAGRLEQPFPVRRLPATKSGPNEPGRERLIRLECDPARKNEAGLPLFAPALH